MRTAETLRTLRTLRGAQRRQRVSDPKAALSIYEQIESPYAE
jgi:hypothetical protein